MLSSKKIFVIENIDASTEQAQNKMLKIIEEPPKNVYFLISANNERKVLKTILSRVQKIYIDKIDKKILKNILNINSNIKEIAISNGDGNLGKTLDIAQNEDFFKFYNNIKELIFNLKNRTQIPQFAKLLNSDIITFENSLKLLSDFYRDLLIINALKEKADNMIIKLGSLNLVKNENLINDFKNITNDFSIKALIEIIKRLNLCKQKLDSGVNLATLADNILLEILEVKFLWK